MILFQKVNNYGRYIDCTYIPEVGCHSVMIYSVNLAAKEPDRKQKQLEMFLTDTEMSDFYRTLSTYLKGVVKCE